MDLEQNLCQNFGSHSMHLTDNYVNLSMTDELHFGVYSSKGFLQDHFHHLDQFHANGTPSNSVFDNFTFGCTSEFDSHDYKPFAENNGRQAYVKDNNQCREYGLNLPQRPAMDMVRENHCYMSFDCQEIKPASFTIPDEASGISLGDGYYKKDCLDKNRDSPINRRTYKVRKKPNFVKGQWTLEEDRLLVQLVEQYGIRKWSHIAQMLPGRIGKQCRERWHNHLRPDIKKGTWSEGEDTILIQAHSEIGNKWAEIAKRLPGRTENSIKNHWNATKRRQYSKRKSRSKYPKGSVLQEYIKSLNLDTNPPLDYSKSSSVTANRSATRPQHGNQLCTTDRLVPSYEFNEVRGVCFDKDMFQEACGIDFLLDGMPCAPVMDEKDNQQSMTADHASAIDTDDNKINNIYPSANNEVKKELDLVEMMSEVILYV